MGYTRGYFAFALASSGSRVRIVPPNPPQVDPRAMSDPAGQIRIRVATDRVHIGSTRPVTASRVFVGRTAGETARLLPALFSICAIAQSAASVEALEQAAGRAVEPAVSRLRRELVDAETLREHLWRILLDWPLALGEAADMSTMARVVAEFGALKTALIGLSDPMAPGAVAPAPHAAAALAAGSGLATVVAERVLGRDARDWLSTVADLDALGDWAARTDTVAARLFSRLLADGTAGLGDAPVAALPPALARDALDARLSGPEADRFVAEPSWDGQPAETSPLTRAGGLPLVRDLRARLGSGVLTRLAAQIAEVAQLVAGGRCDEPAADTTVVLPGGVGLAQVHAARGLLVHRVRLDGERVMDYRILAPTEWNFHPAGAVALGLGDLARRAEPGRLAALANLYITAIDPCVSFSLEIDGPEQSH